MAAFETMPQINLAISRMLGSQALKQFNNGILVDVFLGQNEEMFVGLSAIDTQDVVALTTAIGRNEMGVTNQAPDVSSFGIVFDVACITEVDAILWPQFSTELVEPLHKLPLGFGISIAGYQTILFIGEPKPSEQVLHTVIGHILWSK